MLKQLTREAVSRLAGALGLPRLLRHARRRRVLVLMYHAVVADDAPFRRWTHVPESALAWQLDWLQQHYRVRPLREVLAALRGETGLPDNTAVLTFDDGFASVQQRAFPLLRAAGLPAAVFLTTGLVGSQVLPWTARLYVALRCGAGARLRLRRVGLRDFALDGVPSREAAVAWLRPRLKAMPIDAKVTALDAIEAQLPVDAVVAEAVASEFRQMSWPQAESMARSGLIELGAHGASHEILSRLSEPAMRREVQDSCAEIARRTGRNDVLFAYPNGQAGDFTPASQAALREAGAVCGLSAIEGLCAAGDDPFALRRVGVGAGTTRARFIAACSGFGSFAR